MNTGKYKPKERIHEGHPGKTLLIDNYDSFTWNVYQYLSELGADVVVYRNDEVTVEECIALNPRNLVISPGPGRPANAGISMDIIKAFAGKIPILGVCLGEQCMFEVYGGVVTYAGEIVHGKTSPIRHDGKGLYEGIPQNFEITRYHSLAGDPKTLPKDLETTSTTENGIIMGVRHKIYCMEGVQFHPESIASEYGRIMVHNFLLWEGGTWETLKKRPDLVKSIPPEFRKYAGLNVNLKVNSKIKDETNGIDKSSSSLKSFGFTSSDSILNTIRVQRLKDINLAKSLPGNSHLHLSRSIAMNLAPTQIDVMSRISRDTSVEIFAEIKRASPSKGDIDIFVHAPSQAIQYALGGASIISVLTEPKWFKGSLMDMLQVRRAVDRIHDRPAILCKDFVVDTYQILQARLHGADTILLIVAILDDDEMVKLISFARTLEMEPFVEVNNASEMTRAIKAKAKLVGVNNRNLHTFDVDPSRTTDLSSMIPKDIFLVALSGIACRADVINYTNAGARGILVGEALMKSKDKINFIRELKGITTDITSKPTQPPVPIPRGPTLCKICGITNLDDATTAMEAGADFIGMIFARSPRQVDFMQASEIISQIKGKDTSVRPIVLPIMKPNEDPVMHAQVLLSQISYMKSLRRSPFFVGVFSDHSVAQINRIVKLCGLDMVQFHGYEEPWLASLIEVPVIKAFHIKPNESVEHLISRCKMAITQGVSVCLLDTAILGKHQQGGSGTVFDWDIAVQVQQSGVPVMIAGGLLPKNVDQVISKLHPWAVDVSSGVEEDNVKGKKNTEKVHEFVSAAKRLKTMR